MVRTGVATHKFAHAERVASALACMPDVGGVALFGSVARGTEMADSDIDLLVLLIGSEASKAHVVCQLPRELRRDDVALSVFTEERLRQYLSTWSRFAMHLQREGVVLHDTGEVLTNVLGAKIDISIRHELDVQSAKLEHYARIDRFGGRLLFPLAHLFQIGRTAVFARLAVAGEFQYDRTRAFADLARTCPELASDVEVVERLLPFHLRVRDPDYAFELPFDPNGRGAAPRADAARRAVQRILDSASAMVPVHD